ncbi:hypothetical protein J6590_078738 [Homalodisca vitripennis]|nr:hypothetical protein J6590_078738 [Homalodisca vitripennis]
MNESVVPPGSLLNSLLRLEVTKDAVCVRPSRSPISTDPTSLHGDKGDTGLSSLFDR